MPVFFSPDGPLASHLDNYEPREGQKTMAEAVTCLISGQDHNSITDGAEVLVVEAETGIGKTLAYLVPAILSGKRIVVSTATLNLQDQIMNKEIPLIEKALGTDVPVICIKGRQNYLCLYRWFQYRSSAQLSLIDDSDLEQIDNWLNTTEEGDKAELNWLPERSGLWPKISAHSNQCLGGDCPDASDCFVNRIRKKAGNASLLIVNHHLFFSDLALRQAGFGEVLPRYEGVIFDEAHHIENVATTFFGRSFSQYQLFDLVSDIERQADTDLDPVKADKICGIARGIKKRTEEFASLFPAQRGRFNLNSFIKSISTNAWQAEIDLLSSGIDRLQEELGNCKQYSEGWLTLEKRAEELCKNLIDIALPDSTQNGDGFVYWYERRERSISLSSTPVKVANHLQKALYGAVDWCVMTSATLSTSGNFSYLQDRLGLPEKVQYIRLASPFDYQHRTLLYVPEVSFPEPSATDYQLQACVRACELLKLSNGRGLVLCTSFRGMESMAEYLGVHLDYPILVQGSGSRNALLQSFREIENSVLIAVASFWEGVDVQGEALSCVIIDKLPFEVPTDPVIQARSQAITANGGNAFFDFQVPRAILTLRQGAGRLMRSATDKGIVAILDVRLFTKGYGKRFRDSLPPSPIVRTFKPVAEFFSSENIL